MSSYAFPVPSGQFRKLPNITRLLIAAFLLSAFAGTAIVLSFVITAQQLQSSISAAQLGPTKTSIGAIRQDVSRVEHYYAVLDAIAEKQVAAEQAFYDANASLTDAMVKLVGTTTQIRSYIDQNDASAIAPPLKLQMLPEKLDITSNRRAHEFDQTIAAYFAQYYASLENQPSGPAKNTARAKLDAFKAAVDDKLGSYTAALEAYNTADSSVQSRSAQIIALQKARRNFDASIGAPGSALANTEYWTLCESFYSFKKLVGDWAYRIVLLPQMILVLILVTFMGILGSLICISRNFVRNISQRNFWDILFRIGLGAGAAFAVFFLAASGTAAFSQGGISGQAALSPYLVSFLGITAGYFSDRLADWMRKTGNRALHLHQDEPERWGVGLQSEEDAKHIDYAAVARAIGVPLEDVLAWADLRKAVPPERQKDLALYLHADRSKLFTDVHPEAA